MTIRFNNYSKPAGKRGNSDYYRWRVFVDEPEEVLDNIKEVEYLLHKTFPQPFQVKNNREDKFALETSGWGSFQILITVKFIDGHEEKGTYWLDLNPQNKPWPAD